MRETIAICKTYPSDFEKIYPLLLAFDSPYTRDDWKKIFTYRWDGARDYVGYHLEKNGEAVGFMGLIFSSRLHNNCYYQFCNITSLIVIPEHRQSTILFLRKLSTYSDVVFTGLGPIAESYRLLSMIGFIPFENEYKIISVLNSFFHKKSKLLFDQSEKLFQKLDSENKRLALDHASLKCKNILFEHGYESCLLIYAVLTQKYYGIQLTKIHLRFISNLNFFHSHFYSFLHVFKKTYGLCSAIYIDGRLMRRKHIFLAISKKINPPKIYSKTHLDSIHVDALYSEVVLLG